MAETSFREDLSKKTKKELIESVYQLTIEVIELQNVCKKIKEVLLE